MGAEGTEDESRSRSLQFATTYWSVVLAAGDSASSGSKEALDKLCRQYWFPLYAYVRRRAYSSEDSKDMTQGFFERILERDYVKQAKQQRGRIRSFLLASLNHCLSDQRDLAKDQK